MSEAFSFCGEKTSQSFPFMRRNCALRVHAERISQHCTCGVDKSIGKRTIVSAKFEIQLIACRFIPSRQLIYCLSGNQKQCFYFTVLFGSKIAQIKSAIINKLTIKIYVFTISLQFTVACEQIAHHLHRIFGCAWSCGHAIATVSIVMHNSQATTLLIGQQFWLHTHHRTMWTQSDTFTHNFSILQTRQQIVAALLDGHTIVLAPLRVVAIELPATAQRDSLESGQHIGIVVAIECCLNPGCTHLQHLTAYGHQMLVVAQLLGTHPSAVEQHIELLWHIEEVAHMLTHHLATICQESVGNRIYSMSKEMEEMQLRLTSWWRRAERGDSPSGRW